MRHWNRGKKTVRNLILAFLLGMALFASLGFPPYTVRGMCRQFRRDYLLEDLQPLYVHRRGYHNASRVLGIHKTTVLARSGEDTYAVFRYHREGLDCRRDLFFTSRLSRGGICTARKGQIYAAGPFENAASATAVVRAEKPDPEPNGTRKSKEFLLEGKRLKGQVFAFPYDTEYSLSFWEDEQPFDYEQACLPELVERWYRRPVANGNGAYHLLDRDLPCTVTLYDEAGNVLEVLRLAVTSEELRDWL